MRPSLRNIRYFLLAVLVEFAAVVCVFFLLPIFVSTFEAGCDGCTSGRHFLWAVERGVRIGLTFIMAFLIYMWFIVIPVVMVLPVIGLVLDCKRMEGGED
jgi:hypothetical protein